MKPPILSRLRDNLTNILIGAAVIAIGALAWVPYEAVTARANDLDDDVDNLKAVVYEDRGTTREQLRSLNEKVDDLRTDVKFLRGLITQFLTPQPQPPSPSE